MYIMLGLNRYEVRVVDYDPAWKSEYCLLADQIRSVTSPLELELEHIGSTSVPGLPAKPIIDVGILLHRRDQFDDLVAALVSIGLIYRGDKGPNGGQLFISESGQEFRTHHIHAYFVGDSEWDNYLTFRDRLRASSPLRNRYGSLKRKLASQFSDDRFAYSEAKSEFVNHVLGTL